MTGSGDDGPNARMLPDGRRLHLQHGPIDLVIGADGAAREIHAAYRQAVDRFRTVLAELVTELEQLRQPTCKDNRFDGDIARRMQNATWPHAERFITPMAAVAGAVADEVLDAMLRRRSLQRAFVNNGGDIALHLDADAHYVAAIATGQLPVACTVGTVRLTGNQVGGIATSGRHGRSLSLGIADSVTVLAADAAAADAGATMIANAVDLPGSAKITRVPARMLDPDSDLGARHVTTGIGLLAASEIARALDAGLRHAAALERSGLIRAAFLSLAGSSRATGDLLLARGIQDREHA